MAQEIIPRLLVPCSHLSPLAQLLLIAAVVLGAGVGVLFWPAIQKNAADQLERARPARLDVPPGTGGYEFGQVARGQLMARGCAVSS